MLYDPRWEKKIEPAAKPKVRSLAGLIAWLERQPAEGRYDFTDLNDCLLTQYFKSHNRFVRWTGTDRIYYWIGGRRLPPGFYEVARGGGGRFGDALERARAAVMDDDKRI